LTTSSRRKMCRPCAAMDFPNRYTGLPGAHENTPWLSTAILYVTGKTNNSGPGRVTGRTGPNMMEYYRRRLAATLSTPCVGFVAGRSIVLDWDLRFSATGCTMGTLDSPPRGPGPENGPPSSGTSKWAIFTNAKMQSRRLRSSSKTKKKVIILAWRRGFLQPARISDAYRPKTGTERCVALSTPFPCREGPQRFLGPNGDVAARRGRIGLGDRDSYDPALNLGSYYERAQSESRLLW